MMIIPVTTELPVLSLFLCGLKTHFDDVFLGQGDYKANQESISRFLQQL